MEDVAEEYEEQRDHDERHAKLRRLVDLETEVAVLRELLSRCVVVLADVTTLTKTKQWHGFDNWTGPAEAHRAGADYFLWLAGREAEREGK